MRKLSLAAVVVLALSAAPARAYVEAPMSLGAVIAQSNTICLMQVVKVDKAQGMIIYQKVRDVKGKHNQDTIKHLLKQELKPGEIKALMEWAEPGKMAVFFHNGSASETCTGLNWYQCYPQGEWWGMSHGEPFLLRSYAGKVEKLPGIVSDIVAGKEVLVPCMIDGNKDDLHKKTARIQRLKASLKIQDYNPKRDFSGWGGEDIRRLAGMNGFSQFAALGRVDAEGQSVACVDLDGDGKIDVCLSSTSRVVLLQNQGDSFSEVALPGLSGGSRATVWADYNGDGKPDVLLATVNGPKLYTNLGNGQFRDDSALLPQENAYDLTGAAWIDADGDGQPDILLANGFHGLRLYKNKLTADAIAKLAPPKLGDWHYIGPFDNAGMKGFDAVYPPEKDLDLKKQHPGKGGNVAWKPGNFPDGSVNSLALFAPQFNNDSVVYLHREIEVGAVTELPVSLGSDDTLTVWLNGEKLLAQNEYRALTPDQHKLTLKLKPGKNQLLLKVCQGQGDWAFTFAAGAATLSLGGFFEDVSAAWGLGPDGKYGTLKGDSLAVCDVNGDGKSDFLYAAGKGMLFVNSGKRFELKEDSGLTFPTTRASASFADFDGDGHPDVLIAQRDRCRLFRNDGTGKFAEVTDQAGDLAKPIPFATSAAWGDFNNDGKPDLVIGCLRGPNRYLQNNGDGTFTEKSDEIGLSQKVFNSQAVALADLNGDGKLDLILVNEAQDSAILFGNKELAGSCSQVVVSLGTEAVGSRLRVLDKGGKAVAVCDVSGGEGRGGQPSLSPRFTLPPGEYKIECRSSSGRSSLKEITVADSPLSVRLGGKDEPAPPKK
jgi:hypothetical protein